MVEDTLTVPLYCPRRSESPLGMFELPDEGDGWHRDACDFCGSMAPAMFMARVEAGDVELGPTDKNYKVYVRNKGGAKFKRAFRSDALPWEGWESVNHTWVVEERDEFKFYFQHLSSDQKDRLLVILNENSIKIGYPGYFYVTPYFAMRVNKEATHGTQTPV